MKTIFLFFLVFIFHSLVFGQQLLEENYAQIQYQELEMIRQQSDNSLNIVQVIQLAKSNSLINFQQNIGSFLNIINSNQIGNNNDSYINEFGTAHLSNTTQYGENNEANLWSEGFSTQNIVVQIGNNNLVNQFIENYYAVTRSAVAVQLGNGNKIELALLERGEPNNLMGAMVTQTGDANSAELVLNQSDASYFKVNQSGGAEITVTQSDFYFPMK